MFKPSCNFGPSAHRCFFCENGPSAVSVLLRKRSIATSVFYENVHQHQCLVRRRSVHRHHCLCENGPSAPVFFLVKTVHRHQCSCENGPSAMSVFFCENGPASVFLRKLYIGASAFAKAVHRHQCSCEYGPWGNGEAVCSGLGFQGFRPGSGWDLGLQGLKASGLRALGLGFKVSGLKVWGCGLGFRVSGPEA